MARSRKPEPKVPNGFVASAVRLPTQSRSQAGTKKPWQQQAWVYYDAIGELRFLANWIGNVMSRASLHAAYRAPDSNELVPATEGPARDAMDALYGGPQQQSQMLHSIGVNMTVSGEAYILARGDSWDTLATGKVNQSAKGVLTVDAGDGNNSPVTASDLLIRVWSPHPIDPMEADAATRSNLKTLAQITGYDDHISAQLTSRLAGAGILALPSEIEFAMPEDADPESSQADSFMQTLHDTMGAALEDRNSPTSFVPIVITVPGEYLDKLPEKPISFWSELDESVIQMRESAIKRFAVGMDVPPEALMGNGDSNHWNAFLSEDAAIKVHLEPRLGVINAALTQQYLRPALEGVVPDDELDGWFVIADTSDIRTRPNKSTDARELRDMGLINDEATRRENGFKPEDGMDEDEYERWLLQRVALGAVTPEITAEALKLLGAKITATGTEGDVQEQPRSLMPAPTDDTEDRDMPDPSNIPGENGDPLAAACEVLVWRALERAGNRLRNKRKVAKDVPLAKAYLAGSDSPDFLLEGAWECAIEVLGEYDGVDVNAVVQTLDFYTRGLLQMQRPHSRNNLSMLLRSWDHSVA